MRTIEHIYIDGRFVVPHGSELFDLHNPTTGTVIGRVRLGDAQDADAAIAAAKRALPLMARTTKAERLQMLEALYDAMRARAGELKEAMLEEYGAPIGFSHWMSEYAAEAFLGAAKTLADFPLEQEIGSAQIVMEPVGVVGLITPWNANGLFICGKLAYAIAAGCTAVIKPSEMSALQTDIVLRALHEAGLPAGVYNLVNGRGAEVGAAIAAHPDVAKISFTGSTAVGKSILRASADTLKRVTLELGGKSPTIVLDDADLDTVIPGVIETGFMNSGQACIAGTRVLVSEARRDAFETALKAAIETQAKVGDPRDPATTIGPMVSQTQWERVQRYIHLGLSRDSWLGQRDDHALTVKVYNGCMDGFVECGAVGEGLMSEVMRLEIVPDHFDVIQFWRVFWQPLDREPVCACGEGCTRKLADVDWPVVLDQHDRPG